jgi:hypothetical protein
MDVAVAEAKAAPAVVQAMMWGQAGRTYAKAGTRKPRGERSTTQAGN